MGGGGWLARWLNVWLNGRCGSIFAVVVGTMGKSVKYVAVTMLAACCAGCFLAQGQEQESVAEEARMQGYEAAVSSVRIQARDTVSDCFRSQVSDAVAKGEPGEAVEAVSETAAVGNKRNSGEGSAENKVIKAGEEIGKSEDILRTRLSLLTELRQEWYGRLRGEYLRQDALTDLIGALEQMPASAFHPRYLPLDVVEDNLKWAASRPLEVSEILARDRRLILTRMINGSAMPQFLRDLRAQNPAVYSVFAIIIGIFGGGSGFLCGSPMEMLVPKPVVGGQPWFDDMLFYDPNFDRRIYMPSKPLPLYDPEEASR